MAVPTDGEKDGLSIVEMLDALRTGAEAMRSQRHTLLRWAVLALSVGVFFAFASGEEYEARTRLLPYRSAAGAGSGLSGLAGLAGIRLPAGAVDQTITAELYPEVARSWDFRAVLAETPLRFSTIYREATVVEYFRELRRPPLTELLLTYTIGLPGKVISLLRPQRPASPKASALARSPELISYDREYAKILRALDERLVVVVDRRTSVITISGLMPDPYAAAELVRVTSDLLMGRIIDYESRKAREQLHFIEGQHVQAKARYEGAQVELATYVDRNRMLVGATSQVERDRLQRQHDIAFEVYQQLSRELEQARIKTNQDTPVFTVLENATVPSERKSPNRALTVLASLIVGLGLGIARIMVRKTGVIAA